MGSVVRGRHSPDHSSAGREGGTKLGQVDAGQLVPVRDRRQPEDSEGELNLGKVVGDERLGQLGGTPSPVDPRECAEQRIRTELLR